MAESLATTKDICEALVRHMETSGSECFEKNFVVDGKIVCSVWCIIGPNAQGFRDAVHAWLQQQGFEDDSPRPRDPSKVCRGHGGECSAPACCERAGEYNGFGSDGPTRFTCPKGCSCHD